MTTLPFLKVSLTPTSEWVTSYSIYSYKCNNGKIYNSFIKTLSTPDGRMQTTYFLAEKMDNGPWQSYMGKYDHMDMNFASETRIDANNLPPDLFPFVLDVQ